MSGWSAGYVTDVPYIAAFHSGQSQTLMALAALLNGFSARPVRREETFHWCDAGCGAGITALVTAAANPGWQVTALDFNPGHIAAARELAREAEIGNVAFLEADLREFADTPEGRTLASFDAVTAHGVWSWVDDDVQDGLLKLLNAKLKPGGMFQVSYNLLTGWQSALGLQRLLREAGRRLASRSDKQVEAGLKVAKALAAAGSPVSYGEGFGKVFLGRLEDMPASYNAHEMMNENWRPVLHGDVAARLAAAKLDYAGSCRLLTNFPQLTLSAAQRAVLEPFDDPAMFELFKDICKPQALRNDVFIRGGRRIDADAREAALYETVLALTAEEQSWTFTFEAADGQATMAEGFYRPIFERLARGPASVGELLALPDLHGERNNAAELIGVAIGTSQAMALPNPGAGIDARCARLNGALVRAQFAAGQAGGPVNFALPSLGHGMTLPNFEGMMVHELAAAPEVTDPGEMAARLGARQDEQARAELAASLRRFFATDAPLLRHFGFRV